MNLHLTWRDSTGKRTETMSAIGLRDIEDVRRNGRRDRYERINITSQAQATEYGRALLGAYNDGIARFGGEFREFVQCVLK